MTAGGGRPAEVLLRAYAPSSARLRATHRARGVRPGATAVLLACLLAGCAVKRSAEAPAITPPAKPPAPVQECPEEKELRLRATKLELRLLERDTQVDQLQQQLLGLKRMLDEAIQEVVRSKSKLRGLESRAEAASAMAEAEIALKALQSELGSAELPESTQAEQLLRMSAGEFENGNFGGALYLTGQAKSHLQMARARLRDQQRLEPFAGEVLFGAPLSMRVLTRSNLRSGPGLEFQVVQTLDRDTPVIGHSHSGDWVRVRTEDRTSGWIHQALVGAR